MSKEEQEIAQARIEAERRQSERGEGLAHTRRLGIACVDERIFIYLGAIGSLGPVVFRATADSPLVLYASLPGVIGCVALWGPARIRRIERARLAESSRRGQARR